ncbi:hypothetical protein ABIE67_009205 [Streptomyces sp. V4I8]
MQRFWFRCRTGRRRWCLLPGFVRLVSSGTGSGGGSCATGVNWVGGKSPVGRRSPGRPGRAGRYQRVVSVQVPAAPPPLTVDTVEAVHVVLVRVSGELDVSTAPRLAGVLGELEGRHCEADLATVSFMDSTGIELCLGTAAVRGLHPARVLGERLPQRGGVALAADIRSHPRYVRPGGEHAPHHPLHGDGARNRPCPAGGGHSCGGPWPRAGPIQITGDRRTGHHRSPATASRWRTPRHRRSRRRLPPPGEGARGQAV